MKNVWYIFDGETRTLLEKYYVKSENTMEIINELRTYVLNNFTDYKHIECAIGTDSYFRGTITSFIISL